MELFFCKNSIRKLRKYNFKNSLKTCMDVSKTFKNFSLISYLFYLVSNTNKQTYLS